MNDKANFGIYLVKKISSNRILIKLGIKNLEYKKDKIAFFDKNIVYEKINEYDIEDYDFNNNELLDYCKGKIEPIELINEANINEKITNSKKHWFLLVMKPHVLNYAHFKKV